MATDNEKQKPETDFRSGLVRATVWKNTRKDRDGNEFEAVSVKVERRFKDKDGEYKSTNSYRPQDLPRLALVVQKAFEHVALANGEANGKEE